jgi:type I restriction enzyme, S subunit
MNVTAAYKSPGVGIIPQEWQIECLDGCVRSDAPICYGILMPGPHCHDGVLVVKVKNIIEGCVDESDLLRTHPLIDDAYKRSRLLPGDVLITIRGSTGRVAVASIALKGANITQDTARIRVKEDIDTRFIYYALQSESSQHFIRRNRSRALTFAAIGSE